MTKTGDRIGRAGWRGIVTLLVLFCAGRAAFAQGISDVIGKSRASPGIESPAPEAELRFGRDRVDLGLTPGLRPLSPPGKKVVGFSAQADLRLICGQFDLKASLQHLLGREARQEFIEGILNSLVQEVVGSGMELLCQAEPTMCTLLQNYSVSANMKMSYYKDICQAIEAAVVDAEKKNYANSVDQCLKEKKDQGVPLDKAMDACQKKPIPVTGFHGELLGQFDLGQELHSLFGTLGLSPGAATLAQRVSDEKKVVPGSVGSQLDPNSLTRYFDEKRDSYAQKLGALLDQVARRQPVATVDLRAAVPEGAPPLAEDEIRELALLSPQDRAAALGSISTALAIFEMGKEIREVERALEVLKDTPGVDEAKRHDLEARRARLQAEKLRLVERLKDQSLVLEAYGAARNLSLREYQKRLGSIQARWGETERRKDLLSELAAPGALPQRSGSRGGSAPQAASTCSNCGLQSSFGSSGEDQ
jgi:hypothetical protein